MEFATIDFETANNSRASICSAGIAIIKEDRIYEAKEWLIRPRELKFNPVNVAIHGITGEDVEDKPEFNEVWEEMLTYLEGNIVLAHNASFDMACLRGTLNEYKLECPNLDYACTLTIAREAFPGLSNYKLSTIMDYLNIHFHHHDATEDARACAFIALTAGALFDAESIKELLDKLQTPIERLDNVRNASIRPASRKHESCTRIKDISATCTTFDCNHPFYDKHFAFTGELETMTRSEAMQMVINLGGYCHSSVVARTHFLVVGELDPSELKDGVHSGKIIKAQEMISRGGNIVILTEQDFLTMLY